MSSLIPNHTPVYRQIRLHADLSVVDIFSIRRTTREDDPDYQTTYQDPTEGRYVLTCNKKSDNIRVFDLHNNVALPEEQVDSLLARVPSMILEWLRDASTMRHSNFVPVGFGWDGKFTRAEYQKRQRANLIFIPKYMAGTDIDNDWLQVVLDEICRTPKKFLTLRWDEATALPLNRMVSLGDGFNEKHFIFIDDAGNHRVQKVRKIVGNVSQHPGLKIPNDVSRVIILTKGVTCDDEGNPAGCGVELLAEKLGVVTTWEL